jgi:glycosyltransferase involved in cell wall biosynthesis
MTNPRGSEEELTQAMGRDGISLTHQTTEGVSQMSHCVAVLEWIEDDGISEMLMHELAMLGYHPVLFRDRVPSGADIVFSHAPFGKLLPIYQQLADRPNGRRPGTVHWNTEGLPDLRIPLPIVATLGDVRSWVGRLSHSSAPWQRVLGSLPPLSLLDRKAIRFRYAGDYSYGYRHGMIDVLADSSEIYVEIHRRRGIPAIHLPWGASDIWYANMGVERDIDVLWIGKRGSKRRSLLLDRVRQELGAAGIEVCVVDGEERPFVYGEERTELLNRAKVVLNLTRTWYDDNYSRFALAATNRSLIVSEPMLPHCSEYQAGTHYVSAPIEDLARAIRHYLEHEDERNRIVESARDLVVDTLSFSSGLKRVMDHAISAVPARRNREQAAYVSGL